MNIVDRRLNPTGKSLGNRQRFIDRAREEVRGAVAEALRHRKVSDTATGETVSVPTRGITEPTFRHSSHDGRHEHILPGNKHYVAGDRIPRPEDDDGTGGSKASAQGDGEDAFVFALTRDEFLNILFEDMELPDLVKTDIAQAETWKLSRAGHSIAGSPANLNLSRTMRNSLARRVALQRPKRGQIAELEARLADAEAVGDCDTVARLEAELKRARHKARMVAYIDPVDVRYNLFTRTPEPKSQAVMFCLMDVSGSMTEYMKDLAKRFFLLLHVFLERRYRTVDIVFIRHTSTAQEVDEETFFYGRETGGTIVSTALEEMLRVVRERYPLGAWNIYAAQASDGDNLSSDAGTCASLLEERIMPLVQHFAYIEIRDRPGTGIGFPPVKTNLWRTYEDVAPRRPRLAMRKVAESSQIFPVFHDLFAKDRAVG